ncbi:MAG: cell division protein FtsZ [Pontibacterium sp.]
MFEVSDGGIDQTRVLVLGVGGAGCNALSNLSDELSQYGWLVNLVAINTDAQALGCCRVEHKIQIGKRRTKGKGAGGKAAVGYEAALENSREIKSLIESHDLIFLATNLGRGTGTGASPYIAKLAADLGKVCVACVGLPMTFGRPLKGDTAKALNYLRECANSVIVLEQDRLMGHLGKSITMENTLKYCDNLFGNTIHAVLKVIFETGKMNVDFADVMTIARYHGNAIIAEVEFATVDELNQVLFGLFNHPVFQPINSKSIQGLMIALSGHEETLTLGVIEQVTDFAAEYLGEGVEVSPGVYFDNNQTGFKVMVMATGARALEAGESNVAESLEINEETTERVNASIKNSLVGRSQLPDHGHFQDVTQDNDRKDAERRQRTNGLTDDVDYIPAYLRRSGK